MKNITDNLVMGSSQNIPGYFFTIPIIQCKNNYEYRPNNNICILFPHWQQFNCQNIYTSYFNSIEYHKLLTQNTKSTTPSSAQAYIHSPQIDKRTKPTQTHQHNHIRRTAHA